MNSPIKSVLVTGANGFVGKALCSHLVARGIRVVAAVRRPAEMPPQANVEIQTLELSAAPSRWESAIRSVDCVIHLTAWAHRLGRVDVKALGEVNVDGSRFAAQRAAAAGARRFILLSSVKVNGEGMPGLRYGADDSPKPEDEYGASKWAAESAVREICEQNGLEWVIIRPPLVYGPGVKANFRKLMKLVDLGIPLPFGSVSNQRSMIGIRNLSSFIETCMHHSNAAGRVWLVSDGEDLSLRDLVTRLSKSMARKIILFPCPVSWLNFVASSLGKSREIRRLTGSLQVDIAPTRSELNWEPEISVDQELARTVAAFKMERS